MTNEEKIARFMGWKQDEINNLLYRVPLKYGYTLHRESDFTTDMNRFTEVWNKAVDEILEIYRPQLHPMLFDKAHDLVKRLVNVPPKFTVESRLPILIEIIDFLEAPIEQTKD